MLSAYADGLTVQNDSLYHIEPILYRGSLEVKAEVTVQVISYLRPWLRPKRLT